MDAVMMMVRALRVWCANTLVLRMNEGFDIRVTASADPSTYKKHSMPVLMSRHAAFSHKRVKCMRRVLLHGVVHAHSKSLKITTVFQLRVVWCRACRRCTPS